MVDDDIRVVIGIASTSGRSRPRSSPVMSRSSEGVASPPTVEAFTATLAYLAAWPDRVWGRSRAANASVVMSLSDSGGV